MPDYLSWWFWFTSTKTQFKGIATAATIAHLPGIKLKKLRVPVPSLSLQKVFANRIEIINKQKTLLTTSLTELETLYKSLTQRAFAGELFAG